MAGKLNFLYGTMGSAKTADLLIEAHNHEIDALKVMAIKPESDRYPFDITSRIYGLRRTADFVITPKSNVYDLIPNGVDSLFVDEVQFFTPEQIDQLLEITKDKDANVFTYGLRTDFKMEGFPGSNRLLQIAHEVKEKYYRCRIPKCKNKSVANARFIGYDIQTKGEQVVIDNKQNDIRYFALCLDCYTKLINGDLEKQEQARMLIDTEIKKEIKEKAEEEAYNSLKEELEYRGITVEGKLAFELHEYAKKAAIDALQNLNAPKKIRKKD